QFLFKNLMTERRQRILQLFINTGRRAALDGSRTFLNNAPEPIPLDYDCSLMISSRVFFGAVLPASASGWTLRGDDPNKDRPEDKKDMALPWTATYTGGQLTGTVDFSSANFQVDHTIPGDFTADVCVWKYAFSATETIAWPVKDMTLKPNSDGVMRLSFMSKGGLSVSAKVTEWCQSTGNRDKGSEPF